MKQLSKERQTKAILVIGAQGCGKSTLGRKLVNKALENKRRVLVVSPGFRDWRYLDANGFVITNKEAEKIANPVEIPIINLSSKTLNTFTGISRAFADADYIDYLQNFANGVLIMDDCAEFFATCLQKSLKHLAARNRHQGVDLVVYGHGFGDIPRAFFRYISEIFLFQTIDSIEPARGRLAAYKEIEYWQKEVNNKAKNNKYYHKYIQLRETDY